MAAPIKDYPDFAWGIYAEIVNAYIATKAVVENDTITEEVEDSYETLLDWDTLGLGKKMLFLGEAATGVSADDIDLIDPTEDDITDAWTEMAKWTIAAADLLTASFKRVKYDGFITAPNTQIDYKVTYKRADIDETTIITGTDTFTSNVWDTKTHDISPEVEYQHNLYLIVRFYLKATAGGGYGLGKNFEVRYDDIHEPVDYRILTYAYADGISYTEAQDTLAAEAKIRVVVSDVYAQVKVQAKTSTAGRKGKIRLDYIGVSL